MRQASPVVREAGLAAGAAASLSTVLAWAGPPGSDLAAHIYQRAFFIEHGFALWNNFWYAGRYGFVTYSVLYYPLAALLGIRLLAVATVATAALAFAAIVWREWGPRARWSSRTFAVVWAGIVLSAAFPFALGAALALLALWALQAGKLWRFTGLALLTLAASPVAFLLMALILCGIAAGRRASGWGLVAAAVALSSIGTVEVLVWRVFPAGGRYPFSPQELAAACVFCVFGIVLTWHIDRARTLRFVFPVYGAACIATYFAPWTIGENIARLRFAAIPLTVLVLALRDWRPRLLALVSLGLAVSWNVTPLAASFVKGSSDPAAEPAYWAPAIAYLRRHLTPSFRVEAVDTTGHWDALYLPRAGIPVARGWFRQDDFPVNAVLYERLGAKKYLAWLHSLGVRYVILTDAPVDYSARGEARLIASGRVPLRPVLRTPHLTIYEVSSPRPLVTGPAAARVRSLSEVRIAVALGRPGTYRVAVRYSPYWRASRGCVTAGRDRMIRLSVARAGRVDLVFTVDAKRALNAITGRRHDCD